MIRMSFISFSGKSFGGKSFGGKHLTGAALLGLSFLIAPLALADGAGRPHGLSIFGDLKYPPDFTHFDYVNPDAPKGGTLSHIGPVTALNGSFLSFDTLNGYILKGDAPQGLAHIFDTLMVRAWDEPDAVYGLLAESVEISEGGDLLTFHLRKEARFHDGSALTAEDAAFSFQLLKDKGHPLIAQNLREMASVRAAARDTLEIRLTGNQTRDLPLFIAQALPVFSKAYYTAHPFDETTLEPPLGSGPYRIGDFKPGQYMTYERVRDYWGKDLPVNIGKWNFDRIRYEYYRERTAQFEAFKAGSYLLREEFTSKTWATEYDFPAVADGRVVKLVLRDDTPSGAQGWFINTRLEKFQDINVRKALSYAFDFEWTNKNLFYDLYRRTESFFENSPMKAQGRPTDGELALLRPYMGRLPGEVFGDAVVPPRSDGSGRDRALLTEASRLLDEAGWRVDGALRRNEKGETLRVEFLTDSPSFERIIAPYVSTLRRIGVDAKIRLVDSAQYQDRLKRYDFDLTTQRYSVSSTPGIEMRAFWNSEFADIDGGRNLSGIQDSVVDALIERVIEAPDRPAQRAAARALDRVLRAGHYWIPQWFKASHGMAFWDVFGRPAAKPRYHRGVIETWWIDADKAARLDEPE